MFKFKFKWLWHKARGKKQSQETNLPSHHAPPPALLIGSPFPNLMNLHTTMTESTPERNISSLKEWQGGSWMMLFSHPHAFTPICTTEVGTLLSLKSEFDKRDTKVIAISTDSHEQNELWKLDIESLGIISGVKKLTFPIISDEDGILSRKLGMLPYAEEGTGLPPVEQLLPVRGVFVISPSGTLQLSLFYPATTGRNFDELIRVLDSLQLTSKNRVGENPFRVSFSANRTEALYRSLQESNNTVQVGHGPQTMVSLSTIPSHLYPTSSSTFTSLLFHPFPPQTQHTTTQPPQPTG